MRPLYGRVGCWLAAICLSKEAAPAAGTESPAAAAAAAVLLAAISCIVASMGALAAEGVMALVGMTGGGGSAWMCAASSADSCFRPASFSTPSRLQRSAW